MAHRINARLDEELAAKLEELSKLTGKSASAIIKTALDAYYERMRGAAGHAKQTLTASGFIGCAEGGSDLSERYKTELGSWSKKT